MKTEMSEVKAILYSEDDKQARKRAMYSLLTKGGYERVHIDYESDDEVWSVADMEFDREGKEVRDGEVPADVKKAVEEYVFSHSPDQDEYKSECAGEVWVFTASEHAFFDHTEYIERRVCYDDGTPGPDAPDFTADMDVVMAYVEQDMVKTR